MVTPHAPSSRACAAAASTSINSAAAANRSLDGRPVIAPSNVVAIAPIGTGHYGTQYDLSPDGRRVYFLDRQPAEPPREIGFMLGWREVLT
jgi:hypothetical protein